MQRHRRRHPYAQAAVLESEMVSDRRPGHHWTLGELIDAARPFGVSAESFLRRLATLGLVPISQYTEFRAAQIERRAREANGGGNSNTPRSATWASSMSAP